MTIITYGPNMLWTSGSTTTMTASKSRKATKIVYISYGRDDIMIETTTSKGTIFRRLNGGSNQSMRYG